MKNNVILLLLASATLVQCTSVTESITPATPQLAAKLNYDEASAQLMTELAPKIVGDWKLQQVNVQRQSYNNAQLGLGIRRDTTFQDFATLSIRPAAVPRSVPRDLRRGEYDGTIQFRGKTYPVRFDLMAGAEWIVSKKGPQAFFLLDFAFPNGTRIPEPEQRYLEDLGLLDNFGLDVMTEQPKMVWNGLNRGVARIEMVKQ